MAPYRFLGGECVVVVVGNYKVCSCINEVCCPSACPFGFATRVEAVTPPKGSYSIEHKVNTLVLIGQRSRDFVSTRASQ